MKRFWTLGIPALFAVASVACGHSSTPTAPKNSRALVKLSLPERVVAVPSADPRFAMEATIPMVASESAGVSAYINQWRVEATDEATGVTSYPLVFRDTLVETIPAGGSVKIPFRVGLSSRGTYRAKVTLDTADAGGPSGTVPTGGVPANGSGINLSAAVQSQVSGDFRILPPQ
jgi:hypothetical protein